MINRTNTKTDPNNIMLFIKFRVVLERLPVGMDLRGFSTAKSISGTSPDQALREWTIHQGQTDNGKGRGDERGVVSTENGLK